MDISLEFIKNEKRFSHHFAPYRTVDLISSNCTKINHNVFICSIKYCLIISPQSFRFMPFILLSHCVLNSVCIVISCSFIISHLVFCFFLAFSTHCLFQCNIPSNCGEFHCISTADSVTDMQSWCPSGRLAAASLQYVSDASDAGVYCRYYWHCLPLCVPAELIQCPGSSLLCGRYFFFYFTGSHCSREMVVSWWAAWNHKPAVMWRAKWRFVH